MAGGANSEEATAWDGPEGERWARWHVEHDLLLAAHQRRLMAAAELAATEHVLDVGCGTGQSTRAAAVASPQGSALGLDLSGPMLELARRLSAEEGLANVAFEQGDAQVHPLQPATFDVAISRFGLMFFDDPTAAFTNIATALRPGGRLVALAWDVLATNEWLALPLTMDPGTEVPYAPAGQSGPFALADRARTVAWLEAGGFADVAIEAEAAPMWFGRGIDDAQAFLRSLGFIRSRLDALPEERRGSAEAALGASIEEHCSPDGVAYGSTALLITARRA